MRFLARFPAGMALLLPLWLFVLTGAQTSSTPSDPLVSKNIPLIFGVADKFIAFNEYGKTYSYLDLFANPVSIQNRNWPWPGYVQDGVVWRTNLLLRADSVSDLDSARVPRVALLPYDGKSWRKSDSLVFPFRSSSPTSLARGAGLTAIAVWHDTAIFTFGKLWIAYSPLAASENADSLFLNDTMTFSSFPTGMSGDTVLRLGSCVWNHVCEADSFFTPAAGLDSILSIAVDSSAPDSIWLLVSTQSGTKSALRRGLLGGKKFPVVASISDTDKVKNMLPVPGRSLLWAFTDSYFFLSKNHGASFAVPDSVPGIQTAPAQLKGYSFVPQAAAYGDTTFVSFNLTGYPGLVLFKRDTLQEINHGDTLIFDVLLNSQDGLGLGADEGSITSLAVAYGPPGEAILALGSDVKGIFYRRLDEPGTAFINKNRLRPISSSLSEVITFPTLFGSELLGTSKVPKPVHIGYRLKKNGNVTITVFNYAMEKVRTVVKNRPRIGGVARSENSVEDLWDGKDASGRYVSAGTYYILVESDQGEKGFGKAISLWGQR